MTTQPVYDGEGGDEGGEDGVGKRDHELLTAVERSWHCPSEVSEPMHEVESDIPRGHLRWDQIR